MALEQHPDRCARPGRRRTKAQRELASAAWRREVVAQARRAAAPSATARPRDDRAGIEACERSSSCENQSSDSSDALMSRMRPVELGRRPVVSARKRRDEEAQRVQRLAQVVARGGEESGLRAVGRFGRGPSFVRRAGALRSSLIRSTFW